MSDFELRQRKSIYHGRVVDLAVDRVRLPNGTERELELIEHPGAAAVVPVNAHAEVVLIRQARYATGGWLLEVPAGTLSSGETPDACAQRELEEETGYRANRLTPLGAIWTTPGFTNEQIWLFLAEELSPFEQRLDADEVLTLEQLPLSTAIRRAQQGDITDAKTVCALLRVAALRTGSSI